MTHDKRGSQDDLLPAIRAIARAQSPHSAARQLLELCIKRTGSNRGRIYLFDRATASYRSYVHVARSEHSTPVNHPFGAHGSPHRGLLEKAIVAKKPIWSANPMRFQDSFGNTGDYQSRLIIPIIRENDTCIGLVDLDGDAGNFSTDTSQLLRLVSPVAELLTYIYEWDYRRTLVDQIQEPIDFDLAEHDFFEKVAELIIFASQAEFFVLREYDEPSDRLRTLRHSGLSVRNNDEELDLIDVSRIPPFQDVVSRRQPHAAHAMTDSGYQKLRSLHAIDQVRSFVACPVLVGTELFGVLSFGSSVEYMYTYDEIAGLQSIANGVGLSILNYRHFQKAKHDVARFADIGAAITAIEVAQAVRHEALGLLSNADERILIAQQSIGSKPPKIDRVSDQLTFLGDWTQQMGATLDKIKQATKVPDRERVLVPLKTNWTEAVHQLSGRIAVARVRNVSTQGQDVSVMIAPDWFRQVFINLILNSCDAFGTSGGSRQNRTIQLVIDPLEEKASTLKMRYWDNAGGINFSRIRHLEGRELPERLEQAIFLPNVTSRSDGSGWGLALCRRIVSQHDGSINLIEHRNRTVFELELPNPLQG